MHQARTSSPGWLSRIETLGTTIVVLLVGGMTLWYEAVERDRRVLVTIGVAVLLYAVGLAGFGWRSATSHIAWWPFAAAGFLSGAVSELINAEFLVTRELFVAAATGLVIGTAHWVALRVWIGLTGHRAA